MSADGNSYTQFFNCYNQSFCQNTPFLLNVQVTRCVRLMMYSSVIALKKLVTILGHFGPNELPPSITGISVALFER